ncbi:MAG: hypothetical protein ACOYNS_01325 [Bacteroidota bacterium]
MKRIALLFTLVSFAFAGKGSLYSRYGIGEVNTFLSGKNVGMGGTGLAMFGETHINLLNPASTANITNTIISSSYQYRTLSSADASGSSMIGTGNINSLAISFPVFAPNKMVLTIGVLPYSSVAYDQQLTQTISGNQVVQSFEGRGGITSGQLSLSYALTPDAIVGLTTHYLFGSIYRDQTISFTAPGYFGGSFNQTFSMSGVGFTLGGIYSGIDKAIGLSDTKNMNLGVTLFTGSSLAYDEETLRNFSASQDTVAPSSKTLSLPPGFSFGLAYLKNKTVYAADVHFQQWSGFSVPGVTTTFQNSIRLGAGVEFLPTSDFIGDDFLKRVSYRFGGYYRISNLSVNGQSIDEVFGTAGISVPMSVETRVHLGLEYGIRGTTASSLIKDTAIRFTIAVSATELMFIQPPIE